MKTSRFSAATELALVEKIKTKLSQGPGYKTQVRKQCCVQQGIIRCKGETVLALQRQCLISINDSSDIAQVVATSLTLAFRLLK